MKSLPKPASPGCNLSPQLISRVAALSPRGHRGFSPLGYQGCSAGTSKLALELTPTSRLNRSGANQCWFQCEIKFAVHDEGLYLANHPFFSMARLMLWPQVTIRKTQRMLKSTIYLLIKAATLFPLIQRKLVLIKHWRLTPCKKEWHQNAEKLRSVWISFWFLSWLTAGEQDLASINLP